MVVAIDARTVEDVRCSVIPWCGRDVLAAIGPYTETDLGALAFLFFCAEYLWRVK